MTYPARLLPSEENIKKYLPPDLTDMPVRVYETIDSTNTQGRRWLAEGGASPCLLVAHTQTAGRGRLGRTFYSPSGSGLYMTLICPVGNTLKNAAGVTAVAASTVAEVLSRVVGKETHIKWVNDLYLNGKKICGILTEAVAVGDGYHLLLGIGLNITTRDFPTDMRHPAGALLSEDDPLPDQSRLCAAIVTCLEDSLRPERAADVLVLYRKRLMLTGQQVVCSRNFSPDGAADPAYTTVGVVEGVDEDYGLILRSDDGSRQVLYGGEISVQTVGDGTQLYSPAASDIASQ